MSFQQAWKQAQAPHTDSKVVARAIQKWIQKRGHRIEAGNLKDFWPEHPHIVKGFHEPKALAEAHPDLLGWTDSNDAFGKGFLSAVSVSSVPHSAAVRNPAQVGGAIASVLNGMKDVSIKVSTSLLRHIYLSDKLKDIPKLG